jgi:replicative DNA helicase
MDAELMKWEQVAKELMRRTLAEEDSDSLRTWIMDVATRSARSDDQGKLLLGHDSHEFYEKVIARRAALLALPESERRIMDWPWTTWNNLIDPPSPGMLGVISAPSGFGKTMLAEMIAEHWARHAIHVVFVHYELDHEFMMDRRMSRHTSINVRTLRQHKIGLTPEERAKLVEADRLMQQWTDNIAYLHYAGHTAEETVASLTEMQGQGMCEAVIIDYIEKLRPSNRQLKFYGADDYKREADNVEQFKTFAERQGIPMMIVAQFSKAGARTEFKDLDRTAIRGAGEKYEKANLVVLIGVDRVGGGYSSTIDVLVDKNTSGPTGTFKQVMVSQYFQVRDMAPKGKDKEP